MDNQFDAGGDDVPGLQTAGSMEDPFDEHGV